MTDHDRKPKFEPLLAPLVEPGASRPSDPKTAAARARTPQQAAALAQRRQRLGKIVGVTLALVGVGIGGSLAWSQYGPISKPDVFHDPFADVLGFALLNKNFNRLSIDERLRILKDMAERLRSMGSGDSALMAAFAAGITGKAREQLESNVRTLMMDVMDKFAAKYAEAAENEREAVLKQQLQDMFAMMRDFRMDEPKPGEKSPEEQLEEMRKRSQERAERRKGEASTNMGAGDADRMFKWVQGDVNRYSSPNERARVTRFMRDMTRYMRGQDVNTGQQKKR